MDAKIINRIKHSRDDGELVELFSERYGDFKASHSYMVSVFPGRTRAGHYHKKKTEAIFPVDGSVEVLLEDSENGERDRVTLDSSGGEYFALLIPPKVAHLVKNITKDVAKVVVFSDDFDLEDTCQFRVQE